MRFPTRRTIVQAAIAAPLMATLPLRAQQAGENPHRIAVGGAEIIVISDGIMEQAEPVMLPDRDRAAIEAVFQRQGLGFHGFRADNKVAVIRTGAEAILVDTGAGPDFMPTLGQLYDRLEAAGVKPGAITKVVFTHAHADHLWGVIDPLGGDTLFDKAQHLISPAEFAFWQQKGVALKVAEPFRGMAAGTQRRIEMIAPRFKTVAPGREIVPGVQLIDTAGHTPGHVSVLVGSGRDQLLIGGDVLVQSVVSFAEPGWRWGPDMDGDQAVAARHRTLDMLATDKIRLLGFHFPWPGVGIVERAGSAYRFVAS